MLFFMGKDFQKLLFYSVGRRVLLGNMSRTENMPTVQQNTCKYSGAYLLLEGEDCENCNWKGSLGLLVVQSSN